MNTCCSVTEICQTLLMAFVVYESPPFKISRSPLALVLSYSSQLGFTCVPVPIRMKTHVWMLCKPTSRLKDEIRQFIAVVFKLFQNFDFAIPSDFFLSLPVLYF